MTFYKKVQLKKDLSVFKKGEVFEVVGTNEGKTMFTLWKPELGIGVVSINEFDTYFSPFEEKPKYKWTPWRRSKNYEYCYRHNGKRCEVTRFGRKASSSCHPDDEFDLQKGLKIAFLRLQKKEIESELFELTI